MGLYLSEINMPKGEGSKLVLQIFPNGEVYDGHGIRLGIAKWAEAQEVPPHGRLIDADALDSSETDYSGNHIVYLVDIDDAPTIIPAEEEMK